MRFRNHSELEGRHAFLSASKPHWTNYTDDKLVHTFRTAMAAKRGTDLHEYAMTAIRLRVKQSRTKQTINQYVNDAISWRMEPEVILFYSPISFGTVDAIGFTDNVLRIHDLKTGVIPAKMRQLLIYAALFCLEYEQKPHLIEIILRIYQNDEVQELIADPDEVLHIMDKIQRFDRMITDMREEDL